MAAILTDCNRTLLVSIGISGFLLQVLLTEGLRREKAGRATNLIVHLPFLPLLSRRRVCSHVVIVYANHLRSDHRESSLGHHAAGGESYWESADYRIGCLGQSAEEQDPSSRRDAQADG